MKFPAYSLLAFIVLTTNGCNEESETRPLLQGEYKVASSAAPGPVKVYTSTGEITNPKVIADFLSRNRTNVVFFTGSVGPSNEPAYILNFNKTDVKFSFYKPDGSIDYSFDNDIIASTSSLLTLAQRNLSSIAREPSADQRCEILGEKIKTASTVYTDCKVVSTNPGSTLENCNFRWIRVIKLDTNGQPFIPSFTYLAKAGSAGNACTVAYREWNTFNPESTKIMMAGDTVAVQESRVNLLKQ